MRIMIARGTTGLHEQILERIGHDLGTAEISPGSVLSLEGLCGRYGVSRTVVREAVRVLESMQVVTTRRRVGVTVRPHEDWDAFDPRIIRWRLAGPDRAAQLVSLSELRLGFEPVAAALAATRATPEQCGALTGAAIGMSVTGKARDLEAYLRHDMVFHRTVLDAADNAMLRALGGIVDEVLAGRTRHQLMPSTPKAAAIRLHADVAQAIGSGDEIGAERAMREIVVEAMQAVAPEPQPD